MKGEEITVRYREGYGAGPNFYLGKEYKGLTCEDGKWILINARGKSQNIYPGSQRNFEVVSNGAPRYNLIFRCKTQCADVECIVILASSKRISSPPPMRCPYDRPPEEMDWEVTREDV